ncbi:hypothetical protein [Cohnella caldifontis]|uniref:hypothetical protein n=1 Tax=Cohnella caldifontis TaxID=3027471 RepID=UPI0023EE2326|nr:hypothetical protein [Cohnella sp. YIM B05605]
MPDWSYRTLFRPLLQRMSPAAARSLTLGAMGTVSRLPGGRLLIRTLGHVEPSPLLESSIGGVTLSAPVGLSGEVDPNGDAERALALLGFGFLEIGPVVPETPSPSRMPARLAMNRERETILYPDGPETVNLHEAASRIGNQAHGLPVFARIAPAVDVSPDKAAAQIERCIAELNEAGAAGFSVQLPVNWLDNRPSEERSDWIRLIADAASAYSPRKPLLMYLPADYPDDRTLELVRILSAFPAWTGIAIGLGRDEASGMLAAGPEPLEAVCRKIRLVRSATPDPFVIQAAAGIHEPIDALRAMEAGADHVLLNSGFVYAGPGLPKRIQDAILHEKVKRTPEPQSPPFWRNWGWMCLLGIGMILGGAIAWLIAVSSVLLPYDEKFLGMSRSDLQHFNPHLLHFMSHDRITLAGTMISIGILYYQLGKHGLSRGLHWAKTAVFASCGIGFPSFFLYLGYGFFDPLHAAAAAVLLPMFLLSMRGNPDRPDREPANLRGDRTWRRAVWGQLCFVVLGAALAIGGLTIAGVGVTKVFVPTDLAYLGVTAAQLDAFNPRLIPLIAHDRAGFGGALLADAAALLVTALWGIRQGARWLWKTLLYGGTPAFVAALSVHFEIGYRDFVHLLPAYFAVFLYVVGLILIYPYMMSRPEAYASGSPESGSAAQAAAASASASR